MLAVPPSDQMKNVERRICVALGMGAKHKKKLLEELNTEVENNYRFSLQQAIVDYILKDPHERVRLKVYASPRTFPLRLVRAPVPWRDAFSNAKQCLSQHLFITNPVMQRLHNLYQDRYADVRFVSYRQMREEALPLSPSDFEQVVRRQCKCVREVLVNRVRN
ncbi:PREDICTED: dynein heavy chain 3, axonemal-like [Priapulus caudatus]|uniref:Dynein heavy chain 3, axonemal-like n=1 Tax=Priapulus caudatus TaxID=37621 RepID=A0ABM1F4C7_PRICU|nr:PREDICTED: dynein heavy chain 3, axonemal-like [Priapulus caudatus]